MNLSNNIGIDAFVVAHDKIKDHLHDLSHISALLEIPVVRVVYQFFFEMLYVLKCRDTVIFHALHQPVYPVVRTFEALGQCRTLFLFVLVN